MIPVQAQAIIALVLLLAGVGGGFYTGYRFELATAVEARADYQTERANAATFEAGLKTCNASVDGIKAAGDKLTASAQTMLDELNRERAQYTRAITAITAIKSTDEKCPTAEAILQTGFK